MPYNGAQFDFIALAQKTRQRQIDQERFRYFHRLSRIAAKLIRLGLADRHDAICRQIIRRNEFEFHSAVSACFQATLPKRESAKFFANIFDVRDHFLSAIADDESFLGQTEFGQVLDITVQRLVSAYGENVLWVKTRANVRQLPIAQRKNRVVNCEHEQISVGNRFVLRCHQHFTTHHITRFRGRVGEVRRNF